MTTQEPHPQLQGSLQFYWYESYPSEKVDQYIGQLAGSTNRLVFLREELESVCKEKDIDLALSRLEYHMENYLSRVYELRDRVFSLVSVVASSKKTVEALRHQEKRSNALRSIQAKVNGIVQPLEYLLKLLDEDIGLRNFHTHDTFLKLGCYIDYGGFEDIYDPHDALVDLTTDAQGRKRFVEFLWKEISNLVERYRVKIDTVIEATITLLREIELLTSTRIRKP
jgi:hypothetical protein